jgi:site-specific DNA-methyltransferase (adenine-specific)
LIPLVLTDRAALFAGDAASVGEILPPESVDALVTDPPAGIGFMGKEWDKDKGGRDQWIEWLAGILRGAFTALKPGAHALVWALPRTSHWTKIAIENAGFEIRDEVEHLFGTGFPKNLDVSKAIDERAGAVREVVSIRGTKAAKLGDRGYAERVPDVVTAPATEAAAQWAGWGTALKPAHEVWILARKPLGGTVAENVLAHGTGALNVDACRIDAPEIVDVSFSANAGSRYAGTYNGGKVSDPEPRITSATPAGRWPANVVLSHGLDCTDTECVEGCPVAQIGEPARFFYVAKPSRAERDFGCEGLPVKSGGEATGRIDGSAGLNSPRAGAGRGGGARNFHPTIKSFDLMGWLITLITPPGGTVLDLFAGSASTGIAALAEGFSFVGIEKDPEYHAIAKARIEAALAATEPQEGAA